MNKLPDIKVPPAVVEYLLHQEALHGEERRQNHGLRAKIDRLLDAAHAVDNGAIVAEGNTCEVALEDIQALHAALKEWK